MGTKTKQQSVLCECGDGRAHHMVEPECWGPRCLRLAEADRCTDFRPVAQQPKVARQTTRVGHKHPETAKQAAAVELPRSGSRRRAIYDWVERLRGATDDELEYRTGWSHQSVSAARNGLMEDGLIFDGGDRRLTRHGHEAIVWVVVKPAK